MSAYWLLSLGAAVFTAAAGILLVFCAGHNSAMVRAGVLKPEQIHPPRQLLTAASLLIAMAIVVATLGATT